MSGEVGVFTEYEPGEKPAQTAVSYEKTAKFFFEAFKQYLAQDADWRNLLITYFPFDSRQRNKFFEIGSQRPEHVVLEMFLEIEKSYYPDRFTKLVEAFKLCGNSKAVDILEGKVIPKDDKARSLIMNKGLAICEHLLTSDIVPVLLAKEVINVKDTEKIMAKMESGGRWIANFELLFILPSKKQDWFKIFMESLIEINQQDLSKKISPEYYKGLQQNGTNEDMSMDLASCQPIESEDRIKADSSKGVIRENVLSDFQDPSLSINNLSPNKPEDNCSSIDPEDAKKSLDFDMLTADEENITASGDSLLSSPSNPSVAGPGPQSLTEDFSCLLSLNNSETGLIAQDTRHITQVDRPSQPPSLALQPPSSGWQPPSSGWQPPSSGVDRKLDGRTKINVDREIDRERAVDEMERQLLSLDVNDDDGITEVKAIDKDRTELKRRAIEGNDDAKGGIQMKRNNMDKRRDLDATERKRVAIEDDRNTDGADRKASNIRGMRDNSESPVAKELKDKQVFTGCSGASQANMNITEAESVPYNDDEDEEVEDEDITLREYQKELAKPALEGKNVIIVAPTGSGKTRVALRIIQEHIRNQRGHGIAKVIFLVNQVALANQQGAACETQLPQYSSKVISGESQRSKSECLKDFIDRRDILIVTAQVLLDSLVHGEISGIGVFSLMVFDECHHTHANHAFNQIMGMYMKQKFEEDQTHLKVLPQIVGLTASVGVGKAKNMDKAQAHIKSLMANLDAEVICTVHDNMEELRAYVSLPEEETCTVPKRQNDIFGANVTKLITMIEQRMTSSSIVKEMQGAAQFETVLKSPAQKGNAQYTQWVSKLIKETAKLQSQEARRFLIPCRAHLEYYNNALIIHNDARVEDALNYLEMEMSRWRETALMNSNEKKLNEAYETLKRSARRYTSVNPKLKKLEELILKVYQTERGRDSRGIVFVKTRDLAKAIVSWMKETPGLRELNPIPFLGQNQSSVKGGMTKVEQDDALKYFRDGKHKLIVATSVAEEGLDISKCNLVIRYDHVTNEIAMVQSRGRGRAQDSKYCVIAESGTGMAEKEELNMIREVLMRNAIIKLQDDILKDPRKFRRDIQELQEEANLDRKLKALGRKGKLIRTGEFELRCFRCNQFICMSSDIKKIQHAHHVIVDDTIEERVKMLKLEPMKYTDSTTEIGGKQICKTCGDNLGPICIHKSIEFPVAKIEKFLIVDINGRQDLCNRWKSAPFKVADLTIHDWKDIIEKREVK